jgi:NADH dehydrogenase FAD-containing subunit
MGSLNCKRRRSEQLPTVLILGASFSGLLAWRLLKNEFNVIVVDQKDFFEFTPSILVALREENLHKKISFKIRDVLKNREFVCGKISRLELHAAFIENSDGTKPKEIPFDYCIIATGSKYPYPIRTNETIDGLESRQTAFIREQAKFRKAKKILVVGGGTVGVELVSELLGKEKAEVHLVTRSSALLPSFTQRAQKQAYKFLTKAGVNIKFETSKEDLALAEFDTVYDCIGNTANSQFMQLAFRGYLGARGGIMVNKHLQISSDKELVENIFAVGDVCLTPLNEEKVVTVAEIETEIAVANIKLLHKIQKNRSSAKNLKLKSLPRTKALIPSQYLVSLGNDCLFIVGDWCFQTFLGNYMKKFIEVTKILELKDYYAFVKLYQLIHFMQYLMHYIYLVLHYLLF